MKSTSCIKKDVTSAVRSIKRKVTYPCNIKINNAIYTNNILKQYGGDTVITVKEKDHLRVYDEKRKFICTAEIFHTLPKPNKRRKGFNEKPYTMKIHESLEHIRKTKLSNLSLFELSVRFNMPFDLSKELRRRIELIQILLEDGAPNSALDIVNNLLKKPL